MRFIQELNIDKRIFGGMLFFLIGLTLLIPSSVHPFSLTLAWDRNKEPEVVGYKIYVGLKPRQYFWELNVGNNNTGTVGNLSEGTPYYFAVKAYNKEGFESRFSNEVRFPDWPYRNYFPRTGLDG